MSAQTKILTNQAKNKLRADGYWVPLPGPQELAVFLSNDSRYREILFGGARGPGKTEASIAILSKRATDRRAKQLVIRRNAEDLSDFEDRANNAYQCLGVKLRRKPMILSFGKKGGRILGGHLKDDDAYTKYQGHEYCRINIEELTQIPNEKMYIQLISSARSKYPDLFPQVFCTTNPGGIGMAWVKKRFVEPDKEFAEVVPMEYHYQDMDGNPKVCYWQRVIDKQTGLWRAFIPATIDDNPILLKSDPAYVAQLDAIKQTDPELYKAWRFGDWGVQFGAVFQEFRTGKHTYSKFSDWGIDQEWFDGAFKIMGMDWGYNDECVVLYATFDKITDKEERSFIYREFHDNHKHPSWWVDKIVEHQKREPVDVIALPHDAYSHLGGNKPLYDRLKEKLDELPPDIRPRIVKAKKLNRERKKAGINGIHDGFALASDGKPAIMIHRNCEYLIETLPTITYAKDSGGEEIDGQAADHGLDAMLYTLLTASQETGRLINKSELVKKTTSSFVVGNVTAEDLGVDVATIIKNNKRNTDWKTR